MFYRIFALAVSALLFSLGSFAQAGFDAQQGVMTTSRIPGEAGSLSSHDLFLNGTVLDSSGAPLKDAQVLLRDLMHGAMVSSAYTAANGQFQFAEISAGQYELVVRHGVAEVSRQISVEGGEAPLTVQMPRTASAGDDAGNADSVSVAEMKVPEKARHALHKAEHALEKRDLGDAQKYDSEALKIYPRYAAALTLRGILELDANQTQPATGDLEQAIQDDGNYAFAYMVLGAAYNLQARWDDAVRTLEHGLSLAPSSWQGYFELSKSFLAKGNYDSALDRLERAQSLAPTYSPIHLLKAHALLGKKDYPDAISELEIYLQNDPNGSESAHARQLLGQAQSLVASNR